MTEVCEGLLVKYLERYGLITTVNFWLARDPGKTDV
jgi:hypothetical protein